MAAKKAENSVVRYDGEADTDNVHVELEMPAKNRPLWRRLGGRRKSGLVLFERSSGSWWNPRFDSDILEDELHRVYFPHSRRRFQYALVYLLLACVAWAVFFGFARLSDHWPVFLAGALFLGVVTGASFIFTCRKWYETRIHITSIVLSVLMCVLLLASFAFDQSNISPVGTFAASLEIVLLFYTFIPMPLNVSVPLGLVYSVAYECLVALRYPQMREWFFIVSKLLLHLCVHILGIHTFLITQIRQHSNLWKVVMSVMAQNELNVERVVKERMIESLMPKSVADEVRKARSDKDKDEEMGDGRKRRSKDKTQKGEIIFRSFNMNQMENVSILFADIVGFTKMSSNKTAEHLVGLLNDLFGRFDLLCQRSGCEKISTLGDCYYCVAGCPEPRADHANCCVEMGLGMIKAIQKFDEDNNESVNMRVGVHTGTVLCGIVGTRRFKFDVWSNDVTLANIMESSGRPGMVHISEASYALLMDLYEVEEGEEVDDLRIFKVLIEHYDDQERAYTIKHKQDKKKIKTYFITGVKDPLKDAHDKLEGPEKANDTSKEGGATDPTTLHTERENGAATALLSRRHDHLFDEEEPGADEKDELMESRKQLMKKDHEIVRMLNEATKGRSMDELFYKPPINNFTMSFLDRQMEEDYRNHYFESQLFREESIASPRYTSILEILLSLLFFLLISACGFLVFYRSLVFVVVFAVCLVLALLVLVNLATDFRLGKRKKERCGCLGACMSSFQMRNLLGVLMAVLPALAIYFNLSCTLAVDDQWRDRFFCFCILVSLLSFCNFAMLASWLKSLMASVVGVTLLVLLHLSLCPFPWLQPPAPTTAPPLNLSTPQTPLNTTLAPHTPVRDHLFSGENALRYEIILDVLLILALIWFLNREYEISYRLTFHSSAKADRDTREMQENKEQADWLLHNIIPEHVSDVVKRTSKYSKNHQHVGVIFATIINFNEFYDEGYEGGREYLRVLNELVSDYEDLLDRTCYKDVEKIKTISSTFMAASGLNDQSRAANNHPYAHLFALIDFATDLQMAVNNFNQSLFNFDFVLNVGYNFGEVTAGVIGTTKLLYDIWGDTVNIASRMYSTGEADRIQVPESTLSILEEMFVFEYRGEIFVKGKGDMKTYLYKEKRPNAHWE